MRNIVLVSLLSILATPAFADTLSYHGNVVTLEDNATHTMPRPAKVHSLSARTDKACIWWNDQSTFGRAIVQCGKHRFAVDDTPTGAGQAE